jgi:hypothetical protein
MGNPVEYSTPTSLEDTVVPEVAEVQEVSEGEVCSPEVAE